MTDRAAGSLANAVETGKALSGKAIAIITAASTLAICVGAAVAFAIISGAFHRGEPVNQSVAAPKARELSREPTIEIAAPAKIKAYTPKAKEKLNLPQTVIADQNEQVISSARVDNTTRPHTVTTTINTQTGESQSYVRPDPYPWLALESRGEASLSVGYKYSSRYTYGTVQPVARLSVRQDFLQVKALHLGVVGTVDSDRDAYIGVGLSYKW